MGTNRKILRFYIEKCNSAIRRIVVELQGIMDSSLLCLHVTKKLEKKFNALLLIRNLASEF